MHREQVQQRWASQFDYQPRPNSAMSKDFEARATTSDIVAVDQQWLPRGGGGAFARSEGDR